MTTEDNMALDHSDTRLEPVPVEDVIEPLKNKMRAALNEYRLAYPEKYPVGANLAAYLRSGLAAKARKVNLLAAQLKEADPSFPAEWVDLPEGK